MKAAKRLILILAGLLAAVGAGLLLGAPDTDDASHSRSYGRSGTSAFAELVRRSGRKVVSERSRFVSPPAGSLAILPSLSSSVRLGDDVIPSEQAQVQKFVDAGGVVIVLLIAPEQAANAAPSSVRWVDGQEMSVSLVGDEPRRSTVLEESYTLAQVEGEDLVSVVKDGEGLAVLVNEGYPVVNSLIGEADNAAFGLKLIEQWSEPGQTVVFMDAWGGGGQLETPFTVFGRAGQAFGWQLILLAVMAFAGAFVRFGPPSPQRARPAGARSLFDAFGELSRRQRRHALALSLVTEELEARIRRAVGVTPQASQPDLIKRLPPDAATALLSAWRFDPPQSGARAAELARALLQATESLEAASRSRGRAG